MKHKELLVRASRHQMVASEDGQLIRRESITWIASVLFQWGLRHTSENVTLCNKNSTEQVVSMSSRQMTLSTVQCTHYACATWTLAILFAGYRKDSFFMSCLSLVGEHACAWYLYIVDEGIHCYWQLRIFCIFTARAWMFFRLNDSEKTKQAQSSALVASSALVQTTLNCWSQILL